MSQSQIQSRPFPMSNNRRDWQALAEHNKTMENIEMRALFAEDPQRFRRYSLKHLGLLLDYSKNRITDETIALLCALGRNSGVEEWRERMFSGEPVNNTENRAVLHTALRNRSNAPVMVDGENVMPFINGVYKSKIIYI